MQIWTGREMLEYSWELVKMYMELFDEIPMSVMGFSIETPTYIKMLEYCIENKVKTTEDLVKKFFNNIESDDINHGGKYM
jgi:hypothetical protein